MKIYALSFITLILLFVYDDILNRDTSDEDEREEEVIYRSPIGEGF